MPGDGLLVLSGKRLEMIKQLLTKNPLYCAKVTVIACGIVIIVQIMAQF